MVYWAGGFAFNSNEPLARRLRTVIAGLDRGGHDAAVALKLLTTFSFCQISGTRGKSEKTILTFFPLRRG
jgi:hypothetical protein